MSSSGSLIPPGDLEATRRPLRDLFWLIIEKRAPQVLDSLRSDVLPVFVQEGAPLDWTSCPTAAAAALEDWVNAVGLRDPWFVRDAFNLANSWAATGSSDSISLGSGLDPSVAALHALGETTASRLADLPNGNKLESLLNRQPGSTPTQTSVDDNDVELAMRLKMRSHNYLLGDPEVQLGHALTEDFKFHVEGWIPIEEKREAFRQRVVKEFESALTAHMDALQRIYTAAGMLGADRPSKTERNLGWLIDHVFAGLSHQEIADSLGDSERVSVQAVGEAIRKARDELGSSFVSRRGRPSKLTKP